MRPDTVRYFERIGLLPAPAWTSGDHRRYDESADDLMRFIQGAQRLGLRVDIAELVELRSSGECPCEPAAVLLRDQLGRIDEQIARLAALCGELAEFVAPDPVRRLPDPAPGTWRPRGDVS